jgi:hypothetical protein
MAGNSATGIASDAEIEAALAQAQAAAESIPSLDDGSGEQVVPIPVQALPQIPPRKPAEANPPPAATATSPAAPVEGGVSPPTPVATVPSPRVVAEASTPAGARPARAEPAPVAPGKSPIVHRVLDTGLWAINRPFEWLSPEARGITGILAMVTIVISLLALFLLPRLFPPVDLLAHLRH